MEFCEMWSTPLLPLLLGPLWPGVVVPVRVPSICLRELFHHFIWNHVFKQMIDVEFLALHSNTWNHLTVCKQMNPDRLK